MGVAERRARAASSLGAVFDDGFNGTPRLKADEFAAISRFARERFGLDLKRGKEELVAARLLKQLRGGGFRSFSEYFDFVRADRSGEALSGLIDALTTNHTSFLREPQHFTFLKSEVLASWGRAPLRIWSAGCSTGEEPYSILCTAAVDAPTTLSSLRVLATDISRRVLQTARAGVYPKAALDSAPALWTSRCFLRGRGGSEGYYRIRPELARLVEFRRLNLVQPLPFDERFHVIFCRNVMIYFDKPTQQALVRSLAARLEPGGFLFVGHSESLTGAAHELTYVRPAIYRKNAAAHDEWKR
jgi:chemotaxis protein methyltransferase CheR